MAPADTWNALGGGLNDMVKAIAVAGPNVYVGSAFTDAGGFLNADNIARWDGTNWHALGDGIARWDGSAWYPGGVGLNSTIYALAEAGPNIFAGGAFINAGGKPDADFIACGVAAWSSSTPTGSTCRLS